MMNIPCRNRYSSWRRQLIVLFLVGCVVCLLALSVGSLRSRVSEIVRLLGELLIGSPTESTLSTVVFKIRLPRVVLGLLVGGALALGGVVFQGIFHNPLVEPFTLGVSGGAALGISIYTCLGVTSSVGLPLAGFLGALVAVLIVYVISGLGRGPTSLGLLLVGIMFSYFSSSLLMLILSLSRAEKIHSIIFWIMGSLAEYEPYLLLPVGFLILAVAGLVWSRAWWLNGFLLGEEEALHLGIPVKRARGEFFLLASILAGLAVSISGIIGFVGLLVPHFLRIWMGPDHRFLIPASFLCGGVFLVACDMIARTVMAPMELPIGIITGILGSASFVFLLVKTRSRQTLF